MFTSILLVLASAFIVAQSAKCPQPEFVHPCTCRPWETGVFVVCHQVNNTNRLRTVFQFLREYEITRLLLKDCHLLEAGGSSIFTGLNVKLLRLIDSSLVRPEGSSNKVGPIAALASSLERLDLSNCEGLFKVDKMALGTLHKLKDLNVVRDNLGTLRKSWLPNPSNITNLRFEQCSISDIETGAMSHITSLKSLTLVKDQLTAISRDVLPQNCMDLVSVDLSENQIQSLPSNFFNGMSNLHTVNLYQNQLRTLDQAIWSPVWSKLNKLWVNGNNLRCDQNMNWIFDQERSPPNLYGTCASPEVLRGRALSDLSRDEIQNQ